MLIIYLATLLSTNSEASTFASKCPNLTECTKAVSQLTGEKYLFNKRDYEIVATSTGNLELTKENAIELLTRALYDEGYTRVPMNEPNTYSIMRIRDARDTALPEFRANATTTPPMPDHYDTVLLIYKVNHEEVIDAVCRQIRSFLPSSSRVVPNDIVNTILITGAARDLKKLIPTIREMDVKPTAALKAKWAQQEKERQAQEDKKPKK
jgi:hypothetical protein